MRLLSYEYADLMDESGSLRVSTASDTASLVASYERLIQSQQSAALEIKQQLNQYRHSNTQALLQLGAENRVLRRRNTQLARIICQCSDDQKIQDLLEANSQLSGELANSNAGKSGSDGEAVKKLLAENDVLSKKIAALEGKVADYEAYIQQAYSTAAFLRAEIYRLSLYASEYKHEQPNTDAEQLYQLKQDNDILWRENERLLQRNAKLVDKIEQLNAYQDAAGDRDSAHGREISTVYEEACGYKAKETPSDRLEMLQLIKGRIQYRRRLY